MVKTKLDSDENGPNLHNKPNRHKVVINNNSINNSESENTAALVKEHNDTFIRQNKKDVRNT